MNTRVYILLEVLRGRADEVVHKLHTQPGVTVAALLEGPSDVITVIEASNRLELAEHTVHALAMVEGMTKEVHLLPAKDELTPPVFARPLRRTTRSKKEEAQNGYIREIRETEYSKDW